MLLGQLDGYLAGLLLSPHPHPQDEWMPPIWGGASPPIPGEPDASARLVELILARRAEIAGNLLRGDPDYRPVFDIDNATDAVLWEIWASGFLQAMGLAGKAWEALFETDDQALRAAWIALASYLALARDSPPEALANEMADTIAPAMIPWLVETVYRRQQGLEILASPPHPLFSHVRLGRNDPCPCGSGQKYKKCCGAA
jgi:uncharacterized protein